MCIHMHTDKLRTPVELPPASSQTDWWARERITHHHADASGSHLLARKASKLGKAIRLRDCHAPHAPCSMHCVNLYSIAHVSYVTYIYVYIYIILYINIYMYTYVEAAAAGVIRYNHHCRRPMQSLITSYSSATPPVWSTRWTTVPPPTSTRGRLTLVTSVHSDILTCAR